MSDPSRLTAWERWELASFDPAVAEPAPKPEPVPTPPAEEVVVTPVHLPTASEVEQIYQQARDEGFTKGREEGYQAGHHSGRQEGHVEGLREGKAEACAEAERFAQLSEKLDAALDALEASVADELLALATAMAREVIRQEISARPETLLAAVREALSQLPHQHVGIYLNPEDASLLRSYLGDQISHAGHRIHEDFKLERGDCILESGSTQLDAAIATRWRRVVENLGLAAAWKEKDTDAD